MGSVIDFVFAVVPWLFLSAVYATLGTMTYTRTRVMIDRWSDMASNDAQYLSVAAGLFFWIAVPAALVIRYFGLLDPNTRSVRAHINRSDALQREAELRTKAEKAKFNEELALRERQRLNGEEIPYLKEELLALEAKAANVRRKKAEAVQEEIAAERQRTELDLYRDRTKSRGY